MANKQKRPHHELEGERSVFLRFRNGFRLHIKPNIREVLAKAVDDLASADDHNTYLRAEIKDIADGSGLGTHPDSTWLVALRELFQRYENDQNRIDERTKNLLLEVLKQATERPLEQNWEVVRQKILDNIDHLSGWERRQQLVGDLIQGIQRNEDGTYTKEEDGQKVQIIGTKTFDEERYEYIAGSGLQEYGTLYRLFKLLALIDIADQYKANSEHFSEKMYCLLHDNDGGSTSYLHWRWTIHGVYDYNPAFWRPRSCFSDPEWLAHDLLATYSEQFERKDPTKPRIPYESSDEFTKYFGDYSRQFEITLNTHLILGDDLEYYFEFEDRHVRWINGDRFMQPMLVIPTNDESGKDALKIGLRFISVISKATDQAIVPHVETIQQIRHIPWFSQPRITSFYKTDPTYLLPTEKVDEYSNEKFVAAALRREGVNASSVFYKFLSFYKIIQLSCAAAREREDNWINDTVANAKGNTRKEAPIQHWRDKILPQNETAYEYLYGSNRCAIAHINRSSTRGVGLTDPDDPSDYLRIKEDVHVIKSLADVAVERLL